MPEITGDSAEAIALELLMTVARAEGVQLDKEKGGWSREIKRKAAGREKRSLSLTGNASPRSKAGRRRRHRFGKSVRASALLAGRFGPVIVPNDSSSTYPPG